MQLGTNHLGHFALTGLLLDLLLATPGARIVNVSSGAHRAGKMNFDDLQSTKRYARWGAYGQSKLANLLFTFELQRRLGERKLTQISVACHPGWAATDLQFVGAAHGRLASVRAGVEHRQPAARAERRRRRAADA